MGQATFPVTGIRLLLHDCLDSPRRRKFLSLFGLLLHRCFDLKPAVEIVLGRIGGDAPANFAVEVEPKEILVFRRDADPAGPGKRVRHDSGF